MISPALRGITWTIHFGSKEERKNGQVRGDYVESGKNNAIYISLCKFLKLDELVGQIILERSPMFEIFPMLGNCGRSQHIDSRFNILLFKNFNFASWWK